MEKSIHPSQAKAWGKALAIGQAAYRESIQPLEAFITVSNNAQAYADKTLMLIPGYLKHLKALEAKMAAIVVDIELVENQRGEAEQSGDHAQIKELELALGELEMSFDAVEKVSMSTMLSFSDLLRPISGFSDTSMKHASAFYDVIHKT